MTALRCPTCESPLLGSDCLKCVLELAKPPTDAHRSDSLPATIGEYQVTRLLGVGGMGLVYEAEQEFPARLVAVKLLRPSVTRDSGDRFAREYEVLARLDHPAIANIYEAGVAEVRYPEGKETDRPFFSMELVDGVSLIEHCEMLGLTLSQRVQLLIQVAQGIHHAHQRGVIHRDLKPENILVTAEGQPKVLDFGIARLGDGESTLQTRAGEVLGTVPYMSPEQLQGSVTAVDVRTDVFALGVLLYEVLTGSLPFPPPGNTLEAITARLQRPDFDPPSRLEPGCAGDLDAIVSRCLAPDPADRYDSAADLEAELRRYLDGDVVQARATNRAYVVRRTLRNHRRAAGAVVVLIAFAVWGWNLYWNASRANDEAVEQLFQSHVSQLELAISSTKMDRRLQADQALEAAAAIRVDDRLRQLAIDSMALDGFHLEHEIPNVTSVFWQLQPTEGFRFPVRQGNTTHIYDGATGNVVRSLAGPLLSEWSASGGSLSPDGGYAAFKFVAHADRTSEIWVWKVDTGEVLLRYPHPSHRPQVIDGQLMVAHESLRVVSLEDGGTLREIFPGETIRTHAPHPEIPHVALVLSDRIEIWNYYAEQLVNTIKVSTEESLMKTGGYPHAVSWSPDGRQLAIATASGHIHLWDVAQGLLHRTFSKHATLANSAMFGPGNLLFSTGWDSTARIWDIRTGSPAFQVLQDRAEIVSADAERVAIFAQGTVRVYRYDPPLARSSHYLGDAVQDVAVSPDGAWVAVAGNTHLTLIRPDLSRRRVLHRGATKDVEFSHDSEVLFVAARDGLAAWRVGSGTRLWHRPESGQGVGLHPDGKRLFALVGDVLEGDGHYDVPGRWLGEFSTADGELLEHMGEVTGQVRPKVSADGRYLSMGGWVGESALWDLTERKVLHRTPARHRKTAIDPTSTYFATSDLHRVEVSKLNGGDVVFSRDIRGIVPSVSFDETGQWLVMGAKGMERIHLVDFQHPDTEITFPLAEPDLFALALSPGREWLLGGTFTGELVTWDLTAVARRVGQLGMKWPLTASSAP